MGNPTATIGAELEGTPSLFSVSFDLATVGYSAHEHLARGTASRYSATGPFEPDGRWDTVEDGTTEYTTRCVVYRPERPERGNGTVVVEWLNVTGGLDVPALWMPAHRHFLRDGYTWVGVSVQQVGIEGGGMMPGFGLRQTDPERYAALQHPGDAYSYDIFTQVARSMREVLPERYGIRVDRVIGVGASQSAFHLTTYVNAIDPLATTFDGFLLQGRAGAGAPLEGWTLGRIDPGQAADMEARRSRLRGSDRIRTDVRVPVMVVQSETDVFGTLQSLPSRQADNERFRLWEVAGAAHCDTYFLCASALDSGALPTEELAGLIARSDSSGIPTDVPINSGPQMHYVLQRAFDGLDRWIRDGVEPASAMRLERDDDSGGLARDELGVGRGGIRTPWVDAPLAVLSGLGQPGDMTELFGTTRALDPDARATLYPGGRDDYVARFGAAADAAVSAGFLLAADSGEVKELGAAAW